MKKCEWCGNSASSLETINDMFGIEAKICSKCKNNYDNYKCIICGNESTSIFKGKCTNCIQIENYNKQIIQNELALGISNLDNIKIDEEMDKNNKYCAEIDLSDQEYDNWLKMGNTVSPKDIKKSIQLRRIWLIVKLKAAGLPISAIDDYIEDLEVLLDACFMKLIGNKCKVVIANSVENKKLIKEKASESKIIASRKDVHIIEA